MRAVRRNHRIGLICSAIVAVGLVMVTAPAADATITSISPGSASVEPGQSTSAVVSVDSDTVSFLSASQPGNGVTADLSDTSNAGSWSSTLTVHTAGSTPAQGYTIRVSETSN